MATAQPLRVQSDSQRLSPGARETGIPGCLAWKTSSQDLWVFGPPLSTGTLLWPLHPRARLCEGTTHVPEILIWKRERAGSLNATLLPPTRSPLPPGRRMHPGWLGSRAEAGPDSLVGTAPGHSSPAPFLVEGPGLLLDGGGRAALLSLSSLTHPHRHRPRRLCPKAQRGEAQRGEPQHLAWSARSLRPRSPLVLYPSPTGANLTSSHMKLTSCPPLPIHMSFEKLILWAAVYNLVLLLRTAWVLC